MNPYAKNLDRIEFVITWACTGRCKHCSEGGHLGSGQHIDGGLGARAVSQLCGAYPIKSLMTFGGEPLLFLDQVCAIHAAGREGGIPKRQVISNGFFTKDEGRMQEAAYRLEESGVNDILLSVDAFHQETIPMEPVKAFARAALAADIPLRAHPAWLEKEAGDNPYNCRTREILEEFAAMGVEASSGNVVFPSGNALKYLGEYFAQGAVRENPYAEDPRDIRSLCISPGGDVLGGNLFRTGILEIIEQYSPEETS